MINFESTSFDSMHDLIAKYFAKISSRILATESKDYISKYFLQIILFDKSKNHFFHYFCGDIDKIWI